MPIRIHFYKKGRKTATGSCGRSLIHYHNVTRYLGLFFVYSLFFSVLGEEKDEQREKKTGCVFLPSTPPPPPPRECLARVFFFRHDRCNHHV